MQLSIRLVDYAVNEIMLAHRRHFGLLKLAHADRHRYLHDFRGRYVICRIAITFDTLLPLTMTAIGVGTIARDGRPWPAKMRNVTANASIFLPADAQYQRASRKWHAFSGPTSA